MKSVNVIITSRMTYAYIIKIARIVYIYIARIEYAAGGVLASMFRTRR